jgi:hypothetical protein
MRYCAAGHAEVVAGRGEQHPAGLGDRPDPLEQRLALGGEGGGEQAVVGLVQGQAVEAIPGEAQGQGVVDAGTLEHLAHDIGADAVDAVVAGEVLVVHRHVEGREVLGQQHHLVVRRQLRMGETAAEQQGDKQAFLQSVQHKTYRSHDLWLWLAASLRDSSQRLALPSMASDRLLAGRLGSYR